MFTAGATVAVGSITADGAGGGATRSNRLWAKTNVMGWMNEDEPKPLRGFIA